MQRRTDHKGITSTYLNVEALDLLSGHYAELSRERLPLQELLGGDDAHSAGGSELVEREELPQVHPLIG